MLKNLDHRIAFVFNHILHLFHLNQGDPGPAGPQGPRGTRVNSTEIHFKVFSNFCCFLLFCWSCCSWCNIFFINPWVFETLIMMIASFLVLKANWLLYMINKCPLVNLIHLREIGNSPDLRVYTQFSQLEKKELWTIWNNFLFFLNGKVSGRTKYDHIM